MVKLEDGKRYKVSRKTADGMEELGILQVCKECDRPTGVVRGTRLVGRDRDKIITFFACKNINCPNFCKSPSESSITMEEMKTVEAWNPMMRLGL